MGERFRIGLSMEQIMEKARFWRMIDWSRRLANGDAAFQIDELREQLEELEPEELIAFDRLFKQYDDRAYRWDLWAAAQIIGGECSDEAFADFRAWLISRGQLAYETALVDPETLVEVVTPEDGRCRIGGLRFAAIETWKAKTGTPFPSQQAEFRHEPGGSRYSEDEFESRFPRLAQRFAL